MYLSNSKPLQGVRIVKMAPDPGSLDSSFRIPFSHKYLGLGCGIWGHPCVHSVHTFKKGELNDKAIEMIMADVSKILPEKK